MDLGSCPGGLNRRDTAVIFTLEFGGDIIGRKVVPVRICTCPKRDLETEEKVEERKSPAAVEPTSPANTVAIGQGKVKMEKRAGLKDGQEVYWVMVSAHNILILSLFKHFTFLHIYKVKHRKFCFRRPTGGITMRRLRTSVKSWSAKTAATWPSTPRPWKSKLGHLYTGSCRRIYTLII
jgi:hypothetical protein